MTSIAATGTTSYQTPLQKLQAELQSEVSSGAISSDDQDALSSALTDIDSSLQNQRTSDSSGARPSPDDLKSKINDLIAGEVSSGKLTSDQAAELQNVFSNTFADGGPGGAGGLGGAGGPGGPGSPGGADASAAPAGAGGTRKSGGHHHGGHGGAKSASDTSSTTDGTSSASDLLQQFLQSLQDQQSSATGYDANGDGSANGSSLSALLIDYQS